ncbi:PP2C family protein-serine/threonine phosphatase [Algivirga pacifica]|uniref:PPM-type phosphatase domain-containing protein n=1 Tax=Algivirga pacifica TaxID=1162670 RepID=A0ABP9DE98_9BACT
MTKILSAKMLGVRIQMVVFTGLMMLVSFFTYRNYQEKVERTEKEVLLNLSAIAYTTASNIDGDRHENLVQRYPEKDGITTSIEDSSYYHMHQQLKEVVRTHHLQSAVYTLVKKEEHFEFIVTSSEDPAFRHRYVQYPMELRSQFDQGGVLGEYRTENGVWLSAFAPIKNSDREVVAVIQVDQRFESFLAEARMHLYRQVAISISIALLTWALLYYFLTKVISKEEENKQQLISYVQLTEKQHRNILNSITYAERLQRSLMPDEVTLQQQLPKTYLLYKSKDKVSGDFPWYYPIPGTNEILLAAVDCTGHGVPGALLSIMGHFMLNDIVMSHQIHQPDLILLALHHSVINALGQDRECSMSNDGMDIAMLKLNLTDGTFQYAGANRPLYWMREGKIETIKGSRRPVGGMQYQKKPLEYLLFEGEAQKGDSFHLTSDGFQDQIGGNKGRRFMTKRVKSSLELMSETPIQLYSQHLEALFEEWRAEEKQLDDVLMIGVQL